MRLTDGARGDSVTVADIVSKKAFVRIEDSASADDFITAKLFTFRTLEETVDVEDSISFKAFMRLTDGARGDAVKVADIVSKN